MMPRNYSAGTIFAARNLDIINKLSESGLRGSFAITSYILGVNEEL